MQQREINLLHMSQASLTQNNQDIMFTQTTFSNDDDHIIRKNDSSIMMRSTIQTPKAVPKSNILAGKPISMMPDSIFESALIYSLDPPAAHPST